MSSTESAKLWSASFSCDEVLHRYYWLNQKYYHTEPNYRQRWTLHLSATSKPWYNQKTKICFPGHNLWSAQTKILAQDSSQSQCCSKSDRFFNEKCLRKKLIKYKSDYFERNWNEQNLCTWIYICFWQNCRAKLRTQIAKLTPQWRIHKINLDVIEGQKSHCNRG